MDVAGRFDRNPQECGIPQGLKEFGYIDGQNVIVDYRSARAITTASPVLRPS